MKLWKLSSRSLKDLNVSMKKILFTGTLNQKMFFLKKGIRIIKFFTKLLILDSPDQLVEVLQKLTVAHKNIWLQKFSVIPIMEFLLIFGLLVSFFISCYSPSIHSKVNLNLFRSRYESWNNKKMHTFFQCR